MATYEELVGTGTNGSTTPGILRDWANRDGNVLPQPVITRCLNWAADICYKKLQIPPLEDTSTFTVEANDLETLEYGGGQVLTMPIPEDLIEPIFIRRDRDETVFNSRIDRRTIYDSNADKLFNSFTQIGNSYRIYGRFNIGDVVELHYYRRLPGLDATYSTVAINYNGVAGTTSRFGTTDAGAYFSAVTDIATVTDLASVNALSFDHDFFVVATASGLSTSTIGRTSAANIGTAYDSFDDALEADTSSTTIYAIAVTPNQVEHWLRDENERILVYGALVEVFNFLDEPESQARYKALFEEEIARLNEEQNRRFSMGGNIQVSYTGRGLL